MRHRMWRERVLAINPICCICGVAPPSIADHVKPLQDGGDWSEANGQSACMACHNWKTSVLDPQTRGLTIPEIKIKQAELWAKKQSGHAWT